MNKKNAVFRIWGGLLFAIGIILSFTLNGLMLWGDLEAYLFTSGIWADERLSTLKCPSVITADETALISATLENSTDKHLERYLIASISDGYLSLVREVRTNLAIQPHDQEKIEWQIYPEDAAFDQRVILFRVYVNPRYPSPSMGAYCGVVYVDIAGITGHQLVAGISIIMLVCLALGILLLEIGRLSGRARSRTWRNSGYTLAGILLISTLINYLGHWIPGLGLTIVAVLLLGILLPSKLVPV